MSSDRGAQNLLLAKVGLKDRMIYRDPEPFIFSGKGFEIYAPIEYLNNSSLRDEDEVYRMTETVLIHKLSGLRIHYLETENYSGDKIEYVLKNIFIKTLENKTIQVEDIDFSNQHFITPEGKISFSSVKKNKIGD